MAGAACGRRNRRPSVSRRGAGRRLAEARRNDRSRHRRARRAFPVSRARGTSHPQRDGARRQSAVAGAHWRAAGAGHGAGLGLDRPYPAGGRRRLRRLSRPCRRCWPHPCAACRRCCTSRTRVMGRANRLLARARHRDCHRLSRRWRGSGARLKAQTVFTGNPVRPQVVAAAATAFSPRRRRGLSASSCSAAARARGSWPISCRRRWKCSVR